MGDQLDEALKHRFIYVPRGTKKDTLQPGKMVGLAIARELRLPLTVLSVQKDGATHHPELAKHRIVTERSGSVADGGVVLAWCPRHKTMEKIQHLEKSVVLLVEWIPGEMEAWAKLKQAYNIVTDEVMGIDISAEAVEVLERIVVEGYKGWTDSISERMVRSFVDDLIELGAYNRDLVLAYARQTKHDASVQRLEKILDSYDAAARHSSARRSRLEL